MNCNVVKDLIPLYIDRCCSEESEKIVKEHIESCDACKKLFNDMNVSSDMISVSGAPVTLSKINDWKASVLQSVLLFILFAMVTVGVALEAKTPYGFTNGFWAQNIVIPATGFMLSLANWYFVRLYKNKKRFSDCSLIATFCITVCAYIWSAFHYELFSFKLISSIGFLDYVKAMCSYIIHFCSIGIILTIVFCMLSKFLSGKYASMLGKE